MARKSVAAERTEQILDSFEYCIKTKGLANTSLEDIADHSKIKRPALRHFIGNREAIVVLLAQRIVDQAKARTKAIDAVIEATGKSSHQAALSLMVKAMSKHPDRLMTIHQLFALSADDPKIQSLMQAWYEVYVKWLSGVLISQYKDSKPQLEKVACGIVMTCMSLGAMGPVCSTKMYKQIAGSIEHSLSQLTPK